MLARETVTPSPRSLFAGRERTSALHEEAVHLASLTMTGRALADLELLLNGGFAPLDGFLGREAWESVLSDMRLPDGTPWPMPVVLELPETTQPPEIGARVALRDPEGRLLAVLSVTESWHPDRRFEAEALYPGASPQHPGRRHLATQTRPWYLGGSVEGVASPEHLVFRHLWHGPAEVMTALGRRGWTRSLAVHCAAPLHAAELLRLRTAMEEAGAPAVLLAVTGTAPEPRPPQAETVDALTAAAALLDPPGSLLALSPLADRIAGPREALWHALVARNHGCSHFLVHPWQGDPAHPGLRANSADAAWELLAGWEEQIGIRIVNPPRFHYAPSLGRLVPAGSVQDDQIPPSAASLRVGLLEGHDPPPWASPPQVVKALRRRLPTPDRRGVVLFFTGLSGAGKSTVAGLVRARLVEEGHRTVTLLDGDLARQHLSSELGFSRAHRDLNVRRIGYVAAQVARHGGVAICAPIAPYAATRAAVREAVEREGVFVEVHVATPLEVCEARDPKGLYARARRGLIPEFTGVSDPYEPPESPEIVLDTSHLAPEDSTNRVLGWLRERGLFAAEPGEASAGFPPSQPCQGKARSSEM